MRVCFRALARSSQPQDEVIVVLDGFRGLLDEAKGLAARTIQIAEQFGPVRARNAGAAAAARASYFCSSIRTLRSISIPWSARVCAFR